MRVELFSLNQSCQGASTDTFDQIEGGLIDSDGVGGCDDADIGNDFFQIGRIHTIAFVGDGKNKIEKGGFVFLTLEDTFCVFGDIFL
jgi:hypothetical protein